MRTLIALFLTAALHAQTMPQLAPAPAGSKPIDPSSSTTSFTFVVAGDNRPASATCPQPPQLGAIVSAIQTLKPAFALWNGDVIYGKDTGAAAGEYPGFLNVIATAGVPVFVAPGNHELSVKGTKKCPVPGKNKKEKIDEPDPSGILASAYTTAVGAPYGMFRYGNSAFIAVNTDDKLDPDYPSDWCIYNGFVSNAQLAALKSALDTLQKDSTVAHIFLFMHRPLHAESSDDTLGPKSVSQVANFYDLVKKSKYTKLSVVFSSHEHLFYFHKAPKNTPTGPFTRTDPSNNGPFYVVTGGAGAPLSKGGTSGVFNHYLTVTVNGSSVTINVVQLANMPSNCSSS